MCTAVINSVYTNKLTGKLTQFTIPHIRDYFHLGNLIILREILFTAAKLATCPSKT